MAALKHDDDTVVATFLECNENVPRTADILGYSVRSMHARILEIERKRGHRLRLGKGTISTIQVRISRDTKPNPIEIQDGIVLVGSDCHYWPGDAPTAHRAFVKLCKDLNPVAVVINGDEFDGASISRHGRIGWEYRPTVGQELGALQERMGEISAAAKCHLLGSYGNHTLRWDTYISANAAALEGVPGTKFDDLLPKWSYAWAWMVNGHTLIKHRIKGGIHATWNNTADAQVTTVTGHMHNMRVTPRTTMSPINGGAIYGVDCGMMADPWGPQFAYMEQGPRNWRAGFAVLTFKDGFLMPPELCHVVREDKVWFRGNLMDV